MGLVQSIAQGIVDEISVELSTATFSHIPDTADPGYAQLDATMVLTNKNLLGVDAATKESAAYLMFPEGIQDYEDFAGVMGYFKLPKLKVGVGAKSHSISAAVTVTNASRLSIWALGMIVTPGGFPLGVHVGTLPVAVVDPVPVDYSLVLHKRLQCSPEKLSSVTNFTVGDDISLSCDFVGNDDKVLFPGHQVCCYSQWGEPFNLDQCDTYEEDIFKGKGVCSNGITACNDGCEGILKAGNMTVV